MKLLLAIAFCLATTGCIDSNTSQSSDPSKPIIPSYTISEVRELSKNERQELERRCLGLDHPTCVILKSDTLKEMDSLDKSFCESKKALSQITGSRLSDKCRDTLGIN